MTQELQIDHKGTRIQKGDAVLLWFENDKTYLVEAVPGRKVGIHCGRPLVVDDWLGKEYGTKVVCEHGVAYLLKPTPEDFMMKAMRESGIVYPKDAGYLIMRAGVVPGAQVLEVGTGSGSLTMALAGAVGPSGHVTTYDRRTDLPKNAVKNINRAGLQDRVSFQQRVAGEAVEKKNFYDVAILDIPTPWEEVEVVKEALKGGGSVVMLNPTFNQIERSAEALKQHGFIRVRSVELLERELLAREGKTRPVQRMVSHTEFLVFGTKTL